MATHLVSVSTAIKCFTCEAERNISCPGWGRSLVDSETELGDSNNLLTSCVTIVVGEEERRVVEQSIMPGSTHCTKIFLEAWEILLNAKWNQKVSISCCETDGCNDAESVFNSERSTIQSNSFIIVTVTLLGRLQHFVQTTY